MSAIAELEGEFSTILHESQSKVAGSNIVSFDINVDTVPSSIVRNKGAKSNRL